MKRLQRQSKFNSLVGENLYINNDYAIELLKNEDNRINNQNVKLYGNEYSSYGGIYKESNSTANGINLFSVEMYAFEIYDVDTDKDFSLVGIVAIKIDYEDINNPILDYSGEYAEVYNKTGENKANSIINGIKNHVTIKGLSLDFIAPTFKEAINILELSA